MAAAGTTRWFYRDLPGHAEFDAFLDLALLTPLPDDWLVVVADIADSTRAVEAGRYREVNAIGAAAIVATLNASRGIPIPYTFGGDGASFCIPGDLRGRVEQALVVARTIAQRRFALKLRIGFVPIADVRAHGDDVLIGRFAPSAHYDQAIFGGRGLSAAERMIKDAAGRYLLAEGAAGDRPIEDDLLRGFECRWGEIPAPSGEVVNLLVQVIDRDVDLYAEILARLREIYGCVERCRPLEPSAMRLSSSPAKLGVEVRIRAGLLPWYRRALYFVKLLALTAVGRWLMNRGTRTGQTDWARYRERLVEHTDFQRFDDMLRMMVSGTPAQRGQLVEYLDELRRTGRIVYGMHTSSHSLVTCMISDYDRAHVHFIDGRGAAYTRAAMELKRQLQARTGDS